MASVIIVNTTDDEVNSSGDCSLREAIIAANTDSSVDGCISGSGEDEIEFQPTVLPATFVLSIEGVGEEAAATGDLDITESLTITGAGAANTIIDANGVDRVFHLMGDITVSIRDLTIQNGYVSDDGIEGSGGGIAVWGGNLELKNSLVRNNEADFGGGIVNEFSYVNIITSTISNNAAIRTGAGISNRGGVLQIAKSTISDNHIEQDFTEGGGIRNTFDGLIIMTNSTVSNNTASFGGGINNDSSRIAMINCTVSGNTANSGGGIGFESGSSILQNNIIAENTGSDCSIHGSMEVTSLGYNLIADSCDIGIRPGDIILGIGGIIDPLLGDFTDDGTPGGGHFPLLAGSPAIDAAAEENCTCKDQIGNSRSDGEDDGRIVCDIGAIEFQSELQFVEIDIKPGKPINYIDPNSDGLIAVAVLSNDNFDPLQINISTVGFGPNGAEVVNHKLKDINNDGIVDKILKFRISATGIICGDIEARLTGETVNGAIFSGTDAIKTVGCNTN
jgi:CSLREA domain-containing protein